MNSIVSSSKPRKLKNSFSFFDFAVFDQSESQVVRNILKAVLIGGDVDDLLQIVQIAFSDERLKDKQVFGATKENFFSPLRFTSNKSR